MLEPRCLPQTWPRVHDGQVFPAPQPGSGQVAGSHSAPRQLSEEGVAARGVPSVGPQIARSQGTIVLTGHGVLWDPNQPRARGHRHAWEPGATPAAVGLGGSQRQELLPEK